MNYHECEDVTKAEKLLLIIERLMVTYDDLSTTQGVAEALHRKLSVLYLFSKLNRVVHRLKNEEYYGTAGSVKRSINLNSMRTYRPRGEEVKELRADEESLDINDALHNLNRFLALFRRCDTLYDRWKAFPLIDWKVIKDHAPLQAEKALSVLRASRNPKGLTGKTPTTHLLYGWTDNRDGKRPEGLMRLGREVLKAGRRGRTASGKRPSIKLARQLAATWVVEPSPPSRQRAVRDWCQKQSFANTVFSRFGTHCDVSHSAFYKAHKHGHAVGARVVESHLKIRSFEITTVITGKVVKVGPHDYAAPAMWTANSAWQTGWVLMRKGWSSLYHHEGELPNPRACTLTLDRASRGNQDYSRKGVADTLRKLRKLDCEVTLNDSYSVGNCIPGTAEFAGALGITSDTIHSTELLKRWRKSNYRSFSRFSNVVKALAEKHLQQPVEA